MSKFKALLHHIIHECRDRPDQLGAVRLNKVLWFADVTAFKMEGRAITDTSYVKQARGPVAKAILPVLEQLEAEGAIEIFEPEERFGARRYVSRKAPAGRLSNRDKLITSAVLAGVLGHTANAISEMSHDDIWHAAEFGEEIPLEATLATTPGEITEEVIQWATTAVEGVGGPAV